ncbi:MAG: hypothetical protein Q9192_000685 [Flavoplaca navasiana]
MGLRLLEVKKGGMVCPMHREAVLVAVEAVAVVMVMVMVVVVVVVVVVVDVVFSVALLAHSSLGAVDVLLGMVNISMMMDARIAMTMIVMTATVVQGHQVAVAQAGTGRLLLRVVPGHQAGIARAGIVHAAIARGHTSDPDPHAVHTAADPGLDHVLKKDDLAVTDLGQVSAPAPGAAHPADVPGLDRLLDDLAVTALAHMSGPDHHAGRTAAGLRVVGQLRLRLRLRLQLQLQLQRNGVCHLRKLFF